MSYNISDQFRIQALLIYRYGESDSKKLDLTPFLMEFQIFEDIFGIMSAKIVLADVVNIPDSYPIMGGELIDLQYRVPGKEGDQLMTWVISSVGARAIGQDNTGYQGYTLELVTVDCWNDSKKTVSAHFEGRYDEIVGKLLKRLDSKKPLETDPGHINQQYICPHWNVIRACMAIRDRTLGSKFEPFFFFEDFDGYKFKSIATLYEQDPYCKFVMGNGRVSGISDDNPDKVYRRVHTFEYLKGVERMKQESSGAFGAKYMILDPVIKRYNSGVTDYTKSSRSKSFYTIDEYPTMDIGSDNRDKFELVMARADKSHEGSAYRAMSRGLLTNNRVKVIVPGDPMIRVGKIVELDIWDRSLREMMDKKEQLASGRWLITAVKHQINRENYYTHLELMKDSHAIKVSSVMNGVKHAETKSTGVESPESSDLEAVDYGG